MTSVETRRAQVRAALKWARAEQEKALARDRARIRRAVAVALGAWAVALVVHFTPRIAHAWGWR
jgi:hypothetical protein